MRYYDVFGSTGFHSAFLTTYSFSAQAFEDVPFPRMRSAGCRNIAVLADQSMLNQSMVEFGPPRYAGSLYHLAKVAVPGAFHPKLTLLLGAEKGRLLVGSANLTALGLGGNKELVADVPYTTDDQTYAPVLRQAFDYICGYAPPDDPWFGQARARALASSPWLGGTSPGRGGGLLNDLSLLLDGPDNSILTHISTAIASDVIERLIVLSPYWDAKLEGLRRLRTALGEPPVDLLIDRERCSLPPSEAAGFGDLQIFDVGDARTRRFTHAKLIIAHGRDWDHVISGSINCSLPALLGTQAWLGNAEAGIYRRVPRGEALKGLGLAGYTDAALDLSELPAPCPEPEEVVGARFADPGRFQLRGNRLSWTRPGSLPVPAAAIELRDREDRAMGQQISIPGPSHDTFAIDVDQQRPRTARVILADGQVLAPGIIVDLDVLVTSTLPVQQGHRARVMDQVLRADQEDLYLLQALSELEAMDAVGGEARKPISSQRSDGVPATEQDTVAKFLTYDDFIRARDRSRANGGSQPPKLAGYPHRSADLLSTCLNRLVGLVSEDLSVAEELDLAKVGAESFATTEPTSVTPNDDPADRPSGATPEVPPTPLARARETTAKIVEAVCAFEKRSRALQGQTITTGELVRLRTLLQVVLAYAQPIAGPSETHRVVPVSGTSTHDWPRLVGRLLQQHFGTIAALRALEVEGDEGDHQRVLEYLTCAFYASHVAQAAAAAFPKSAAIRKPLEAVASRIREQVVAVSGAYEDDCRLVRTLLDKFNERFSASLGAAEVVLMGPADTI